MLELIWLVNRIKLIISQITDDMKTQAATAYVQFMKTDAYKTYTKAYETFIKKNPGYEDKISEKAGV